MKKKLFSLILIVSSLLIVLSARIVFADTTISVHVSDAQTGQSIAGSSLYLLVSESGMNIPINPGTSDSNGNAVLTVPSGYTINSWTVEANGYATQTGNGIPPNSVALSESSSSSPGLNDTGVQLNFNVESGFFIVLFVIVVIVTYWKWKKNKGD